MRKIALVNQKGGCGKTTTAINVASCLADKERKVLLIDLDPQGHAGLGLGVGTDQMEASIYEVLTGKTPVTNAIQTLRENLDAVLSDVVLSAFEQVLAGTPDREYRLREHLDGISNHYDYLIIDSPPSVGLLTFNGLMASDEVIIPVDPSYFSLHGLGKLLDTIQIIEENAQHQLSIRILATNIDRRTNFCKSVVETLTTHFPDRCFNAVIHSCTRLREAASQGKPISGFDRRCNAFHDYQTLTEEILSHEAEMEAVASKLDSLRARTSHSKEEGERAVMFTLEAPPNARVQIAGDFNGWKPEVLDFLDSFGKPAWQKLVALQPGSYQYKYVVDGQWIIDPTNDQTVDDLIGGTNSVVDV